MNLFDLHADTPLLLSGGEAKNSAVDILHHPFKNYIQAMAIFIEESDEFGFNTYKNRLGEIKRFSAKNQIPILGTIKNSGIMLTVENAAFLANDLNCIYTLLNDNVKAVSLTWNGDNLLASGAGGSGGITHLGIEVIKIFNELGIALDISHLSHKAALEGIELANKVLATHSCVYSLHPHRRNLKNEALLALKQKGGIMGLCFYPEFLGSNNVFEAIKAQVQYLLNLGFENSISIGSDFDGAEMAPQLKKTAHIKNLYNSLLNSGLKKDILDNIFYKNAIAFFS